MCLSPVKRCLYGFFLSFCEIKERGCKDRDWRERFMLSIFSCYIFIWSSHDLEYFEVCCLWKDTYCDSCGQMELQKDGMFPGTCALRTWGPCMFGLGDSLCNLFWGKLEKGQWRGQAIARSLRSDLHGQYAGVTEWRKKARGKKGSIDWKRGTVGPAQLYNKQGCDAEQTTQCCHFFFLTLLPKHLESNKDQLYGRYLKTPCFSWESSTDLPHPLLSK